MMLGEQRTAFLSSSTFGSSCSEASVLSRGSKANCSIISGRLLRVLTVERVSIDWVER